MERKNSFTQGPILKPLLAFAGPVLLALLLQSLYGAVDLLVVGRFAEEADLSGVNTGSQVMMTLNGIVAGLSMGMTVVLGHQIGEGKGKEAGETIGAGILLFALIAAVMTLLVTGLAPSLAELLQAPPEAFGQTVAYLRICGMGLTVITAYNLIGSVFRGMGDSVTPLVTVAIACGVNIAGDLLLVGVFHMGAAGAAVATVAAQGVSVVLSLLFVRRGHLPFAFRSRCIRWNGRVIRKICMLGIPVAIQDLLVSVSFLIILAIVNHLGVTASAGVGCAEKVCAFIMLVPSSFMQSMSAFVAQNAGAQRYDRAEKALRYVIAVSVGFGIMMFSVSYFHGDLLTGLFSDRPNVILAGADYLKAYAIDCMLTAFLFCFIGYFNGLGLTRFVMVQGIAGAFLVRVPVSFLMSKIQPVSLFRIGLATPCSTVVQILLCFFCMRYVHKVFLPQQEECLKNNLK